MENIWKKIYSKNIPTEIDPNKYQSIIDVFNEPCKNYPQNIAFTNMGGQITYQQLDQLTDQMASFFQNVLSLKKGDRIALQMPNLLQFPITLFGALKAGLIVVNTNPMYTAREMRHQFKDSGAKVLVILANFAHLAQEVINDTEIKHVVVTEIGDLLSFPKKLIVNSVVKYVKKMIPKYNLPSSYSFCQALKLGSQYPFKKVNITHEDVAFLQYTGGTTGVSKGATLTHKNIVSNMLQVQAFLAPVLRQGEETVITALPMYHIFALTGNCLAFLMYGAKNVLITNPKDIPGFIKELSKHKFTFMTGVNTLFVAMMNNSEFSKLDFKSLKLSFAGGMALQTAVAQRWEKITRSPIIEGYGLSECSPVVCVNPVDGRAKAGAIGFPVPSTEIKMVDESGKEVDRGLPGELCVRGPQVMRGYWNRPDETALVLSKDGWLHTGDVALVDDDGFVKIVDRKKDMILVSGFNVYPNEIEDVAVKHSSVLEAAAIGIPDERSGEVVKLFIVKKEITLTKEDVIKHCREHLVGYKIPREIEFRNELPKSNVGKILRRALRDELKS